MNKKIEIDAWIFYGMIIMLAIDIIAFWVKALVG